jgi:uncharacterized membrane protein YcaP (DUF421 family)
MAIIGNDTSLLGGIIGAATLVTVNALLNRWIAVSERAARILEGRPTTIIEDGRFLPGAVNCAYKSPLVSLSRKP